MRTPRKSVVCDRWSPLARARASTLTGLCAALLAGSPPLGAAPWEPAGIASSNARTADVLAAVARASGGDDARLAQRRERWTYATGNRRIAVDVAVRGDDFRTSLQLDGLTYTAGRKRGVRWRGDGNGVVHAVRGDLQGDPLDAAPQALFPLDGAGVTLAGEARLPARAWVLETHPMADKPAFLYVDEASGSIVREVLRDGKRIVTTRFDRFESVDGARRPRHWRVDDGANLLDVTVDAIEPGTVPAADLAFPPRRVFAPQAPLERSVELDSRFLHSGPVAVAVFAGGERREFLLDTGTQSILVDPALGARDGGATLEHEVLPSITVGPLRLERASVLTTPLRFLGRGILGLDFFFGHVIEIDYRGRRVRVLSADDAKSVFSDPKTTVVPASVSDGLPLVSLGIGSALNTTFVLDTGSQRVLALAPFMSRFAGEVAAHWTPAGASYVVHFIEGDIEVQPYRVSRLTFGNSEVDNDVVYGEVQSASSHDIAVPYDGIAGTNFWQYFDVYFDYDNGRIGIRT